MNKTTLNSVVATLAAMFVLSQGMPAKAADASSPVMPSNIRLPAGSLDRVLFAQVFDREILTANGIAAEAKQRAFIWGANESVLKQGGYGSYYYPSIRDFDKAHTLAWYQKNHPDWIAYKADKTPAHDFEYAWGAYMGLDFTRQDVREYILETFLIPAIRQGYPAIAYDNVSIDNQHHRCGVYHDGQWVQQYTGESKDNDFAAAVLDYIGWVRSEMHARGVALALNAKLDPEQPEMTQKLISLADIWADEGGFSQDSRHGIVDQLWQLKFDLARRKAAEGGYVSMNTTAGTFEEIPASEITWILANFLLVRGEHSYLAITGKKYTGSLLAYPPSFNPPVGRPTSDARKQGTVYERDYQNGLVAVNPSSKESARFTPPPGKWNDDKGVPLSGTITLTPRSGIILLRNEK